MRRSTRARSSSLRTSPDRHFGDFRGPVRLASALEGLDEARFRLRVPERTEHALAFSRREARLERRQLRQPWNRENLGQIQRGTLVVLEIEGKIAGIDHGRV